MANSPGAALSFKQQVVLALLNDLSWLPKANSVEDMLEIVGAGLDEAPKNQGEALRLGGLYMGVVLDVYANEIVQMTMPSN